MKNSWNWFNPTAESISFPYLNLEFEISFFPTSGGRKSLEMDSRVPLVLQRNNKRWSCAYSLPTWKRECEVSINSTWMSWIASHALHLGSALSSGRYTYSAKQSQVNGGRTERNAISSRVLRSILLGNLNSLSTDCLETGISSSKAVWAGGKEQNLNFIEFTTILCLNLCIYSRHNRLYSNFIGFCCRHFFAYWTAGFGEKKRFHEFLFLLLTWTLNSPTRDFFNKLILIK